MKLIPVPQWISIIVKSMLAQAICHLLGSCFFLAGIVVIIVGLATYLTAKHNFNIFFDARDVRMTYEEQIMPDDEKARLNNEKLAKDKKKGKIIIIIGVVLVIASFVVL